RYRWRASAVDHRDSRRTAHRLRDLRHPVSSGQYPQVVQRARGALLDEASFRECLGRVADVGEERGVREAGTDDGVADDLHAAGESADDDGVAAAEADVLSDQEAVVVHACPSGRARPLVVRTGTQPPIRYTSRVAVRRSPSACRSAQARYRPGTVSTSVPRSPSGGRWK